MQLENVAGELAPLLREYGVSWAEQAQYADPWTRRPVRLTVYPMPDRSSAYGAFTLIRPNKQSVEIGEAGVFYRVDGPTVFDLYRFVFFQGNHLVSAEGLIAVHGTDRWLNHLAGILARRSDEQASLPLLPEYLPSDGLVKGSDAYILGPLALERVAPLAQGDWVGFAYGAEVEAARYRVGGREATLLLISYPTPQMARIRLAELGRLFNLNQSGSSAGPVAFARRKSSLVVFASGLETLEQFEALASGVAYAPELSWSEPEPIDDKEIISGLLGIFLGTGLIVFLTVALGLAFGAARLLLLTTLPGRVFDKPVENDAVFLNLQNPK